MSSSPPASDAVVVDLGVADEATAWTTMNDPVMGGRSTSEVAIDDGGLRFSGNISLDNNGGFASTRGPLDPDIGRKAAGARSFGVHAEGDGKTYLLKVRDSTQPWSYVQRFATEAGAVRTYDLPVDRFEPVGMRLEPAPDAPQTLDPSTIDQVAVYILDKQQGPFRITIDGITATT
ncbi:CIA30 family protein [Mycolicibacterium neoaurum]|uniref:CIA30 family protein n=1 Tax=Mycolicibacterium neoaurum TaxID=1795 RepID=UPI002672F4B9|nr:CIA30 family protein [Mycolicibacterium neoaurum]MDO3401415.1 CIA30 family protein [Mycolicibacterium neoaurum]